MKPSHSHNRDPSNGWESIGHKFITSRSSTSAATVKAWAKSFQPVHKILDIGCGFAAPTPEVCNSDLKVYGNDASTTLIHEYQKRFPNAKAKCEAH